MRTSLIASTSSLITVPRASGLHPRPRGLLRQMMGPMRWHSLCLWLYGLEAAKLQKLKTIQSGVWRLSTPSPGRFKGRRRRSITATLPHPLHVRAGIQVHKCKCHKGTRDKGASDTEFIHPPGSNQAALGPWHFLLQAAAW